MEKQTGISLLVKIESSYLNCRSSAVRPHLGARIDASFTKSYEYLQFKLPVTVSHQLFADLHDKICANLIQGFQGVGMHPCADVLLLQIRHGMGKACNDVRHAVLDGTDFFQQAAHAVRQYRVVSYPLLFIGFVICVSFLISSVCRACAKPHAHNGGQIQSRLPPGRAPI